MQLLFRLLEKHKINTVYLPNVLIKMRMGGATNKSIKNIFEQNREILSVLDDYYEHSSRLKFFFNKLVDRVKQFFLRPKKL